MYTGRVLAADRSYRMPPRTKVKSKYFEDESSSAEERAPKNKKKKKAATAADVKVERKKGVGRIKSVQVQSQPDSDDDDDDWEEVEDVPVFDPESYQPELPQSIQITLPEGTANAKKRKTKSPEEEIEAAIRQRINRCRKENQLNMHKCSLLLAIHRIRHLNLIINEPLIRALTLSLMDLVPEGAGQLPLARFVGRFLHWFRSHFRIRLAEDDIYYEIRRETIDSFDGARINYPLIMNIMVCSFLRSLSYQTRLCYLVDSLPIQPKSLLTAGKRKTPKSPPAASQPEWIENYWIEIFDNSQKKWTCYDPYNKIFETAKEIAAKTNKPVSYVLAIDNDGYITEVTARYASDWTSDSIRKRRLPVDDAWWQQTLEPLGPNDYSKYSDADRVEFESLLRQVELPKKYCEYKNHRMFALQRDLLKFQAIYPPDAPPLGFFRDEPVYSRSCVHTLKSRETWLRVARTVKLNEKPYKIVPSRFKWKKTAPDEKEMLELFGEWQTVPYEPPVAQNGIVPRNAYGNVDLYQACMLPRGCVHLRLPGLLRIANKLNIDCVPAIVGFEGTGGGAHPVMDGFVVCLEHQDILVDAWNHEQRIQRERDREKRTKRVLDNWKRLIRGLVIKRNLKIKYGHE